MRSYVNLTTRLFLLTFLFASAIQVLTFSQPAQAANPGFPLYLPVPVGATVKAGGPHTWNGLGDGVRTAVDLGPASGGEMAVMASAAGTATTHTYDGFHNCWVSIAHTGGWETRYYHLKNVPDSLNGKTVAAGEKIGDAGQPGSETCGSGSPNFRHVHFALYRNGQPVSLDGTSIGGYTVHQTGSPYCGYWTRDRDGAVVADARTRCIAVPSLANNQVATNPDTDGDGVPDASDRCPSLPGPRTDGGCPIDLDASGSTSAVVRQSTGFTQVFVRGADDELLGYWTTPGQPWNGPATLSGPGTTLSDPSAVVTQSTGLTQVFARGANNALLTYWTTPGQPWKGPAVIAGPGTTYSAPAAVVTQSTGFTQVYARGRGSRLNGYWTTPGQPWNGPAVIAGTGTTYSAPAAVVTQTTGFTQVFAQGPGNSLNSYWTTPGQPWNGPAAVAGPGSTYSAPAAVVTQTTGFTQVFAQGPATV